MNLVQPSKPVPEKNEYLFSPGRAAGLTLLIFLALVLIAINLFFFYLFSHQQPGPIFFLTFIVSVGFLIPVAIVLYRIYGLIASRYQITRSAILLKWGLRSETIPLSDINWIRRPEEMTVEVPWPPLPMPGAYVGSVRTDDQSAIDFMASDVNKMIFIGTTDQIYGISPSDPELFFQGFERVLQMGTLSDAERMTIRPADWVTASYGNRIARYSLFLSLILLLLLSLWIGFRITATETVRLGFTAAGTPNRPIPARNILILPVLAAVFWLVNLIFGIQLYKSQSLRRSAELLWAGSPLILFCFLIAGFLII